jgi:DNA-binding CsgD family transcriptional regulator/catechol 2,3-dioxygenase-like lactoylglutathione lyase family enzyme
MTRREKRGRPPHFDVLTPAEWRVVEAVRHGLSNPDIARRQGVSLDAVKYHVGNALQKLSLGSRRELRQWDGVRRDSALGRGAATSESGAAPLGAIAQIARTVADVDAAAAWYGEVLGLTLLYAFPGMAFFDCGGVRLYLAGVERSAPESILYFRVDDIPAVHARLLSRGVEFVSAPHRIHCWPDGSEEWLAIFKDNEGRPLGLSARVKPPE